MTVMDAGLDDLLASPEFITDPYPIFRRLRDESPVHWVDAWGCWLLTRAEDIEQTIRDTRRFSSAQRVTRVIERTPGWETGRLAALHENFAVGMAQTDPPDHTRVRGLVSAAFTPRRVEGSRERIQELVDGYLDPVLPTGRIELVADLAHPLPAVVIAEMSGFPVADRERFRDWTYRINSFFFASGTVDPVAAADADAAVTEARIWIHDLLDERRTRPTDDLLSALVAAEYEGGRLTEAELLSTAITLFLGGHDTTTQLLALGMSALVREPAQLALLRERPDLVPAAVEEMLRYDAPFQMNLRYVTEDTEIGGVTLRAGDLVRQALGSADRDPARFEDPDVFRIERPPARHLSFGLGHHFCLGAPLARLQAQIVVETMVRRLPDLRLDPDVDERSDVRPDITSRGLRTLHLAFDPAAVRILDDLPREIRELENIWIPLPDGERMAARIFLPADAETYPVPAIIEYNPYRKRDLTAVNNEPFHGYLAGHGYAGVRLEIRGSGESDGILVDEYLPQELSDAVAAIAWLARQPWCSGKVGMIGNSWAGFNALQVAALRPPELGAIVTSCSTDDRYADDMHYMGGCLLTDTLDWGAMFQALLALPPDPALVGGDWRETWQRRMAEVSVPVESWLRHQRRDDFWRHGSVCEDYSSIEVPVLAVGGWLDGYSNAIPRLLSGLTVPRRAVIGPWAHAYPHLGVPGPGYDFLAEVVRWFDHWLKGVDNGAMDEPMLRAWMSEALPARPFYPIAPGRWVGEPVWPSPRIESRGWALGDGRLEAEASTKAPAAPAARSWASPRVTGLAGGEWCPYGTGGRGPEFPGDQREDDGRSLTWDSAPLAERTEILGAPVATFELAVDRPSAFIAVRLCDVAPDGASTRVTFGVLNLTHRDGHGDPRPMSTGGMTTIRVQLNHTAYAFLPGHRLRLAISTDYWPMVWPSPEPVTLTIHAGALELPVRPPRSEDADLVDLGEPTWGPPAATTELRAGRWGRETRTDAMLGESSVTNTVEGPLVRLERTGRALALTGFDRASIRDDPTSARADSRREFEIVRDGAVIRVSAELGLSCTTTDFALAVRMAAQEDDTVVWTRDWDFTIPRDNI